MPDKTEGRDENFVFSSLIYGKRIIYAFYTVLVLTTITFLRIQMIPGNPFS